MHNNILTARVLSISLLVMVGYGTAVADEGETDGAASANLDEIVVTASRYEQDAFKAPYTIYMRDMQELQAERQVRTIPDALRDIPGVMVQRTAYAQGSPFMRGFTGLRTLFLVDGIRLNNSTFREGPNQYWATVDPLSAYRLEVVQGPTSVLYGSDAIGGTVNAISRSYRDLPGAGGVQWRLSARAASAENSFVYRPEFGYAGERFDIVAAVSIKDFGDLEGGSDIGTQPKTGYDEQDADIKVHYDLAPNQRLTAAFQTFSQDDAWRTHKTVFGRSWEGTTVGSELQRVLNQDRTLGYLQYRGRDVTPWLSELALSVSYHRQEEDQDRIRSDNRRDIQGTRVGSTGLFGHLVFPTRIGTLTTGTEYYDDDVDSYRRDFNADGTLRSVRIQGPVGDDASYRTAAVFVQDQLAISKSTDVTLGLRYTDSALDARSVEDPVSGERIRIRDDWDALTASARFSHRFGGADRVALFGGVSQGFRAPNLSDLTRLDTARSNEIETPVRSLDDETYVSYELGLKFAGQGGHGQAAVYYMDINDMVVRTPTGAIIDGDNEVTKQNSGEGFVTGIELQGRYRLTDAWSMFGATTWMDGELDTFPTSDPVAVREPLDRLMPLTAHAGLRFERPASAWWAEGQVAWADRQSTLSSRDRSDTDRIPPGGTPGYTVLTVRGGWRVSDALSLSLALENLTDEDYRIHGSGVNEAGRNVVLSMFWKP